MKNLLEASNILKVPTRNINNGERFETYAIKREKFRWNNPNDPRKVQKMILSLLFLTPPLEFEEAKTFNLGLFFQMKNNFLT
jgi:aspartate 1-decarboxylase